MIYVPQDNTYNKCYVVQNSDIIRGYDTTPNNNTNYNYRDYYIKSNYIYKDGQGQWTTYSTLPICLDNNNLTNNFYYRNDFADICIIFMCFALIIFGLPYKLFKTFRKGAK